MKLLISEQQYKNILLSDIKVKKVKLTEYQFKRLILKEQDYGDAEDTPHCQVPSPGATMKDGKWVGGEQPDWNFNLDGQQITPEESSDTIFDGSVKHKITVSEDVMTIDEFEALDPDDQIKEMLRAKIKHKKDYVKKAREKSYSKINLLDNGYNTVPLEFDPISANWFGGNTGGGYWADKNGLAVNCDGSSQYLKERTNVYEDWTAHDWLDALAIGAMLIPVYGWGLALGLEGINALWYVYDYTESGDKMDLLGAGLSVVFMLLPGGAPVFRRLTTGGVKNIVKLFKSAKTAEVMGILAKYNRTGIKGLKANEKEILEALFKKARNLSKPERQAIGWIIKNAKAIVNLPTTKKGVKDLLKKNPKIWAKFSEYFYKFGYKSKFLNELMHPTLLEKILYGVFVGGAIYIDKAGVFKADVDKLMEDTIEDPSKRTEELKKVLLNNLDGFSDGFTSLPEDQRDKGLEKYVKKTSKILELANKTPGPGKKGWNKGNPENPNYYDIMAMELTMNQMDSIIKLYKSRQFLKLDYSILPYWNEEYKWDVFCPNPYEEIPQNSKVNLNATLIKKTFNNPEAEKAVEEGNGAEVTTLDTKYIYKLHEGYWFWRLVKAKNDKPNLWKLVTDCGANRKISHQLEEDKPGGVDTKHEYRAESDVVFKPFKANPIDYRKAQKLLEPNDTLHNN